MLCRMKIWSGSAANSWFDNIPVCRDNEEENIEAERSYRYYVRRKQGFRANFRVDLLDLLHKLPIIGNTDTKSLQACPQRNQLLFLAMC